MFSKDGAGYCGHARVTPAGAYRRSVHCRGSSRAGTRRPIPSIMAVCRSPRRHAQRQRLDVGATPGAGQHRHNALHPGPLRGQGVPRQDPGGMDWTSVMRLPAQSWEHRAGLVVAGLRESQRSAGHVENEVKRLTGKAAM